MVVLGAVSVVVGGLVAAITGPLALAHGSWLAAYLVLVWGVGQFAMGTVESSRDSGPPERRRSTGWTQLACLNVGNAAVVVGTLTRQPLLVDAAVVLLLVAFVIALLGSTRRATQQLGDVAGVSANGAASGIIMWLYRVFIALLIISLPVGAVLAHLRDS